MKSSFPETKNSRVKYIESYRQRENTKLAQFFFQTMYEIDLNISLQ